MITLFNGELVSHNITKHDVFVLEFAIQGYHLRESLVGVDSSYHVRTNVSVRRAFIQGISIHKGDVLIFSSVYI